jgi:PAS domain S-box-containing protein
VTLTVTEQLIAQLFDTQPDGVAWYDPVIDNQSGNTEIVDFHIGYCNHAAASFLNTTRSEVMGHRVHALPSMQEPFRRKVFEQCLHVWQTGELIEYNYYNSGVDRYFNVQRSKVYNGILSIIRERTKEIKSEIEHKKQERKYQQMLDTATDGVLLLESIRNKDKAITDFKIAYCNKRGYEIGQLPADTVGRKISEILPDLSLEQLQYHKEVVETGVSKSFETTFLTPDGKEYGWFLVSLSKLGDAVVSRFVDITERKKHEQQIQEQKTLLDNLLKHSANGISVTRVFRDESGKVIDGKTVLANDAAVRLTGIPREIHLSKTATELDPNILNSEYYQLCIKAQETGLPQFGQQFLNLTKRWFELSISKLDEDHFITMFTDITSVKEAQIHQQHLVEELKRSNANLEEFAYAASHDLKEPIRKIKVFMDRLKMYLPLPLDKDGQFLLERMEKATARMNTLVDDLIEYSHVSFEEQRFEEIDLKEKIDTVLEDLEITIQQKGAIVHVGDLPKVKGHRRQLQQMFQNLISNALKYQRQGTAPEITISSSFLKGKETGITATTIKPEQYYHLVVVKDNGIGFEQEYAERIFNVFTRLHGNSEYSGTGIGLSIARKVIENHDGWIWAESRPDAGASFKLLLPAY